MTNTTLIDEFNETGYVILRGLLEQQIVDQAIEAVEEVSDQYINGLVETGKLDDRFAAEPWETRMVRVFENCDETPPLFRPELHKKGLFAIFGHPGLLDIVEQILGEEIRLYPNYSVRCKLPDDEATLVLWHQDAGYTDELNKTGNVIDSRMVNLWTPFVPAIIENGCMQFIPKTHKMGLVKHVDKNDYYLEIDARVLDPLRDKAVAIELDPGDVVLFSNLLFHRGLPNMTGSIRWSSDWRYQDATQPTLRKESGHIVRSKELPDNVVKDGDHWAELSFV